MCNLCKNRSALYVERGTEKKEDVIISIKDDLLTITVKNTDPAESDSSSFRIAVCPFCGRRLSDTMPEIKGRWVIGEVSPGNNTDNVRNMTDYKEIPLSRT